MICQWVLWCKRHLVRNLSTKPLPIIFKQIQYKPWMSQSQPHTLKKSMPVKVGATSPTDSTGLSAVNSSRWLEYERESGQSSPSSGQELRGVYLVPVSYYMWNWKEGNWQRWQETFKSYHSKWVFSWGFFSAVVGQWIHRLGNCQQCGRVAWLQTAIACKQNHHQHTYRQQKTVQLARISWHTSTTSRKQYSTETSEKLPILDSISRLHLDITDVSAGCERKRPQSVHQVHHENVWTAAQCQSSQLR